VSGKNYRKEAKKGEGHRKASREREVRGRFRKKEGQNSPGGIKLCSPEEWGEEGRGGSVKSL